MNQINEDLPNFVNKSQSDTADVNNKPATITKRPSKSTDPLASDLHCYFDCGSVFKKGYDLDLHLKLRHSKEDPNELTRAFESMKFEIALTQRSGSIFRCGLCSKTVVGWAPFWEHIKKHGYNWHDYKGQFGKCEIESASFQCRICNKVIKHESSSIHKHLQKLHGISWTEYLTRVRGELRGIKQESLPVVKLIKCSICDLNFKYIKEHLQRKHKLTIEEYQQLFSETGRGSDLNQNNPESGTTLQSPKLEGLPEPSQSSIVEVQRHLAKPSREDMRNHNIKHCSVCQVNFDSRKQFIDHCQDVHKVKFKPKSHWTVNKTGMPPKDERAATSQSFKMHLSRSFTDTNKPDDVSCTVKSNFEEFSSTSSPLNKICNPVSNPISQIVWPNQNLVSCEDCSESFLSWKEKVEHKKMNCHRVECEACGKTFSTLANLKKHRRSSCLVSLLPVSMSHSFATEVVEEILGRVFSVSSGAFDGFTCPFHGCGQQFGRAVHLKRHLSNFHENQID